MKIKPGDKVIVTVIPSGYVLRAIVNWVTDEECGVSYASGGSNIIPLLPHADNSEIFSLAIDTSGESCYTKNRGNKP